MHLRLWAGALAFCLCLAGCAGAEKEAGEASSHLIGGSESVPAAEPEEEQPLSFDLRALPSEKVESALFGDSFSHTCVNAGARALEWAGEDRLLLLTAREELLMPVEFRVFSWAPSTGETALLADLSDPAGNLSVQGSFVREGTPYLVFNQKAAPRLLSLTQEGGDPIPLSWLNGQPSRTGLGVRDNMPEMEIYDLLEPEGPVAKFQCQAGEWFESLSPDGDYLVFRVENKPAFAVYALDGRRLAEISPLYLNWRWCETPGYLNYSPVDNPRHTVLLDLERGTETVLPIDPEWNCETLLVEPEFSLLRMLDGETGAESIQLLDNRTGTLNPLEIVPGEGRTFAGQLVAYDPERTAAAILSFTTAPDGSDRRAEGYLLRLTF